MFICACDSNHYYHDHHYNPIGRCMNPHAVSLPFSGLADVLFPLGYKLFCSSFTFQFSCAFIPIRVVVVLKRDWPNFQFFLNLFIPSVTSQRVTCCFVSTIHSQLKQSLSNNFSYYPGFNTICVPSGLE